MLETTTVRNALRWRWKKQPIPFLVGILQEMCAAVQPTSCQPQALFNMQCFSGPFKAWRGNLRTESGESLPWAVIVVTANRYLISKPNFRTSSSSQCASNVHVMYAWHSMCIYKSLFALASNTHQNCGIMQKENSCEGPNSNNGHRIPHSGWFQYTRHAKIQPDA